MQHLRTYSLFALAVLGLLFAAHGAFAASTQGQSHAAVCLPGNDGQAHCYARVVTDSKGAPQAASAPSGYGPADFHAAYTSTKTVSTPKVIAIVDAYDHPNILSDLNTYSTQFGIPQMTACTGPIASATGPCFQKVNQQGQTASYPQTNAGWALEIALDVEAAHAMCQNCGILLVEAKSSSYADLVVAVDRAVALGANVVSNSYGSSEFQGETTYDSHFSHPGIAITVSSGDSGYGPQYPAASPYVTAVGGTSLHLLGGTYASESAWAGAGSGCSAYEAKPAFQHDTGCANRTIADVSADADPNTGAAVYDSVRYQGRKGWFKVGGTSLAAPLIAGVYALGGVPAGTEANTLPYGMPTAFHDVATGSNGTCGGSYLCTALSAYDGPTGLGSPNGLAAF